MASCCRALMAKKGKKRPYATVSSCVCVAQKCTLAYGTTTACYFATIHERSTLALAETVRELGQRAVVGKVNMDQNCPAYLRETTQQSVHDTARFIHAIKAMKCDRVQAAITPRFAITCSMELMKGLADLAEQHGTLIQVCTLQLAYYLIAAGVRCNPHSREACFEPPREMTAQFDSAQEGGATLVEAIRRQRAPKTTPGTGEYMSLHRCKMAIGFQQLALHHIITSVAIHCPLMVRKVLFFQTHISENQEEVKCVLELFPDAKNYTDVYLSTGLLNSKIYRTLYKLQNVYCLPMGKISLSAPEDLYFSPAEPPKLCIEIIQSTKAHCWMAPLVRMQYAALDAAPAITPLHTLPRVSQEEYKYWGPTIGTPVCPGPSPHSWCRRFLHLPSLNM
ncbi:hypothetical protein PR048_007503 [Dryococelus australis]|uniref:Amidohydrolase-related domain-containing protein n=1 Tax=Dryococelus australis TaxID=614101 RepID=A0ABQ9HUF4_9NEOP|nr:hypothetical protein PR048_007503 [Dryococelus australis]